MRFTGLNEFSKRGVECETNSQPTFIYIAETAKGKTMATMLFDSFVQKHPSYEICLRSVSLFPSKSNKKWWQITMYDSELSLWGWNKNRRGTSEVSVATIWLNKPTTFDVNQRIKSIGCCGTGGSYYSVFENYIEHDSPRQRWGFRTV